MQKKRAGSVLLSLCLFLSLTLAGCSTDQNPTGSQPSSPTVSSQGETPKKTAGDWSPGETLATTFNDSGALTAEQVSLDLSGISSGYVAVQAVNANKLKFQVVFGETKYNYDLSGDGTPLVVPLQSGNGAYQFRVLENTTADKYIELFSQEQAVELLDDFQPFIRSNSMVAYTTNCLCVTKAKELSRGVTNDADFVAAVFDYLKNAIVYDHDFANSNPKMYYPNPDATIESGKGICFDYGATAAAMLRSQGVPTKLITGYVSPDDIYHAWNMIYLQDQGWITVEIKANSSTWQLIDITFAATGGSGTVGDGTTYKDRYIY